MCGNGPWGFIFGGLIIAAAMLASAFINNGDRATHAAPPAQQVAMVQPGHVAITVEAVTLDVDLFHARAAIELRL